MPFTPSSDLTAAGWFVDAEVDWWTKALYGPPGFEAYVRVRFDATRNLHDVETVRRVLVALASHTSSPHDVWIGVWPGWGLWDRDHPAHSAPHFAIPADAELPYRDYVLTRSALDQALSVETLGIDYPMTPHLIWPDDRAWFVAADVDTEWFAVGGTQQSVAALMNDPEVNAVATAYGEYLKIAP